MILKGNFRNFSTGCCKRTTRGRDLSSEQSGATRCTQLLYDAAVLLDFDCPWDTIRPRKLHYWQWKGMGISGLLNVFITDKAIDTPSFALTRWTWLINVSGSKSYFNGLTSTVWQKRLVQPRKEVLVFVRTDESN